MVRDIVTWPPRLLCPRPASSSPDSVLSMPRLCTRCPVTVWQIEVMCGASEASRGAASSRQVAVEVKLIRTSTRLADLLEKFCWSGARLGEAMVTSTSPHSRLTCSIQATE